MSKVFSPLVKGKVEFEPLADFLLIEPIHRGQTAGGIALPEGADHEPPKGRVVRVGPGRTTEEGQVLPMPVQEGDVVFMHFAYAEPQAITLGGTKYLIARGRDLVAKDPKPMATSA